MLETFIFINETFPWFFLLLSFVFGAAIGSFLNVCIYRIPAERSIIYPGSTCACGQPIAWYNNIPIFSWLILRGRASCCGQKFSIRYPAIELLTAILFCLSWRIHPPIVALIGFLFISFLICATFIDLDHMIIPDRFSIGGMLLGVLFSIFFPSLHGVQVANIAGNIESAVYSIMGVLVGAGLVYWVGVLGEIVFRKPAMGEGDVKFVGFIGAFCGWQGAIFSLFGGAFIGSVILLPVLLLSRLFGKNEDVNKAEESDGDDNDETSMNLGLQVPFGPMLAIGGLVYFLGFDVYVDAYFENFANTFFSR